MKDEFTHLISILIILRSLAMIIKIQIFPGIRHLLFWSFTLWQTSPPVLACCAAWRRSSIIRQYSSKTWARLAQVTKQKHSHKICRWQFMYINLKIKVHMNWWGNKIKSESNVDITETAVEAVTWQYKLSVFCSSSSPAFSCGGSRRAVAASPCPWLNFSQLTNLDWLSSVHSNCSQTWS